MEFNPEELKTMSSSWGNSTPKWDGVIPKSRQECIVIQKILPPEEYKKAYDAWWGKYGEQEYKQKKKEIRQREIEREEARLEEERQKKEREDKELDELFYQSVKKERDKNSKPTIAEPASYEEKSKYEQEAKQILQNLLKEKNDLNQIANNLFNEFERTKPDQTKMAQVVVAAKQLKEIQEMSWRQALDDRR